MNEWNETTLESIRQTWSDVMVALVRAYQGNRMEMWERIPAMMAAAARQCTRLDNWITQTCKHLQIRDLGTAENLNSVCSTWARVRSWFGNLPPNTAEAEYGVLQLFLRDRAAIVALSRIRWDEHKKMNAAARSAGRRPA